MSTIKLRIQMAVLKAEMATLKWRLARANAQRLEVWMRRAKDAERQVSVLTTALEQSRAETAEYRARSGL